MSLPEDYKPCLSCGTPTDSGVCSEACIERLERLETARRLAEGRCPNCGLRLDGYHCEDCDLDVPAFMNQEAAACL